MPVRIGNFYSKSYIEYDSNGDRNKTKNTLMKLNHIWGHFKNSQKCRYIEIYFLYRHWWRACYAFKEW